MNSGMGRFRCQRKIPSPSPFAISTNSFFNFPTPIKPNLNSSYIISLLSNPLSCAPLNTRTTTKTAVTTKITVIYRLTYLPKIYANVYFTHVVFIAMNTEKNESTCLRLKFWKLILQALWGGLQYSEDCFFQTIFLGAHRRTMVSQLVLIANA